MTARLEPKRVKDKASYRPIQEKLNDNSYYKNNQLANEKGDRYFSILNLAAGDKIVFTFSSTSTTSTSDKFLTVENCGTGSTTNLSLTSGGEAIIANTELTSGTAYYVLADGYVDFKTRKNFYLANVVITHTNSSLPNMTRSWGQNFCGLASADITMAASSENVVTYGKATGVDYFYVPTSDEAGTATLTNTNIGFYTYYADASHLHRWLVRPLSKGNGLYNFLSSGTSSENVQIYNLIRGQIVKVSGSAYCAGTGVLTPLTAYDIESTHTRYYQVNTNGTGLLTVGRLFVVCRGL